MQKTTIRTSPLKMILLFYLGATLMFSVLLYQPFSHTKNLSFIDAFFVSTSALSVTGLSPINIGDDLTRVGQLLLMLEFQIGGIGIMAFFTYVLFLFGRDFSLNHLILMSADQNQSNIKSIHKVMLFVVAISLVIEGIGVAVTYPTILKELGSEDALFLAIFHSIAAFTNSGFDLFENGLSSYSGSPLFLLTTSLLMFLGVLGYPVMLDVLNVKKKKKTLFTKVNLSMHFILLTSGFLFFLITEWSLSFQSFSIVDKITNALFLSTSARNSGLSSIEVATTQNTTILVLMLLMFIGGSSSSCGGGIRTSTFAVLISKLLSIAKGTADASLFKKTIPNRTVEKAFLIFFVFFALFFFSLLVISFIEPFSTKQLSFEVISALTTTGLSMGITGELNVFSKILLCLLMLIGRIGVISWIYLFFKEKNTKAKYITEDIIVG